MLRNQHETIRHSRSYYTRENPVGGNITRNNRKYEGTEPDEILQLKQQLRTLLSRLLISNTVVKKALLLTEHLSFCNSYRVRDGS